MKKLIPFVLAVCAVAMVGCTTATTSTTTATTQRQSNARMDPTIYAHRSERLPNLGPR